MRLTARSQSILFLASLSLLGCAKLAAANDDSLSTKDRTAIEAVLEQFRTGWLSGDNDAVRRAFTSNAVLMPHHGVSPVIGMAAIKEFWWPASTMKTTITRFTQIIDEIGGDNVIAYVRGRSEVAWTTEDQKITENWQNAGNFMAVLRKQYDGKWLISHLIWDDSPNERIQ